MVVLNINGTAYNYPELDDEDWGDIATVAMQAMATLTATLRNPTLPAATTGQVRLGNTDSIAWRTFLNDKNIRLYVHTDDVLYYQKGSDTPVDLIAAASGNVTGPGSATDKAIVRFDQTTGQLIQDSVAILSDLGALSGLTTLATSGTATIGGNVTVTGGIINPAPAGILTLAKADGSVDIGDAAVDAVVELFGTNPSLSFGNSQQWLLQMTSSDLELSGGTSGDPAATFTYASKLLDLHGYAVSNIGATFLPAIDATTPLGSTSKNFKSLSLDNGATDGGAIYFNAGTTAFIKGSPAGQTLTIGGFTNMSPSTNDGSQDIGESTHKWGGLWLTGNIGTGTPAANKLYPDLIPKAWFRSDGSTNNAITGVNLIMSNRPSTGQYVYTFRTNMANADYAVSVTPGTASCFGCTTTQSASGFTVQTRTDAGNLTNVSHGVIVMGTQ